MNFSIEAICDIGVVRQNNEDMILIGDQVIRDDSAEYAIDAGERNFMIAVSDGMGGHQAGEVASETVLQRMKLAVSGLGNALNPEQLKTYFEVKIKETHQELNAMGEANPAYYKLGATFTSLFIYNKKAFIINIGDSRLYRLRGGLLAQLTNDHSLSDWLNNSDIPRNILANAFGGGVQQIYFDFEETNLLDGDTLLLCSDGLSGELTFDEIETMLASTDPLSVMVNRARANGGRDNISAIKIGIKMSGSGNPSSV
ncbi:PP2C family protein-serine/threonine phosphatase [Mucilaginibacter paludis]|uniref:Protein serine/threonine phosphatase n=1 Tax=Mucilaginibacter paludis DSM 18603 TaxID=714943 RepID=H1Y6V1_9SPHI|nr:protein phosphatase 2C domain-containing protein [Mucilaginibacter paludis]EHQ28358.1 protein serine/threonine phosphatase [Mucilaginibacter paludis DSM 18603]